MLKEFENYILEKEFKVVILQNKIDIVNYTDIDNFDESQITIKHHHGSVTIKGEKLIISKLLTDEVLIYGKVKDVTFE